MIDMIARASGYNISPEEFRFKYLDALTNNHVYSILMPITHQWEEVRIHWKFIQNKTLPKHVCDLIDKITQVKNLMEVARDLQVFNDDVRPITDDERRRFGVRAGLLNPCIPMKKWPPSSTLDHVYNQMIAYINKDLY